MNNLNKTKILNAVIELANEVRMALLKEKEELLSLFEEISELTDKGNFEYNMKMINCKWRVDKMLADIDVSIDNVTELEEKVCKHYHTDSYSEFYGRALENMHSMEGVYREQTGFAF